MVRLVYKKTAVGFPLRTIEAAKHVGVIAFRLKYFPPYPVFVFA